MSYAVLEEGTTWVRRCSITDFDLEDHFWVLFPDDMKQYQYVGQLDIASPQVEVWAVYNEMGKAVTLTIVDEGPLSCL